MPPDQERWLPVVGWEGLYEVSDQGRVKSVARTIIRRDGTTLPLRERILAASACRGSRGYPKVTLSRDGRRRGVKVHLLELTAFVGPRPPGAQGCHENDVKTDNRLCNLRWDTPEANRVDAVRNGAVRGPGRPKLERDAKILLRYMIGDSYKEIAAAVDMSLAGVYRVVQRHARDGLLVGLTPHQKHRRGRPRRVHLAGELAGS